MKKVILTLLVATSLVACKKEVIEIPESIMIIYLISLQIATQQQQFLMEVSLEMIP